MTKIDFIDYICRPYCMFFREGVKEKMACQGARVAENLAQKAFFDPGANFALLDKNPAAWQNKRRDALLFEQVCKKCEFKAEDCEYREAVPPDDAEPCGGFILLALLMAHGVIDDAVFVH